MLFILSFLSMYASATVNIRCPLDESNARLAICSSVKNVVEQKVERPVDVLVKDLIQSVCIKPREMIYTPKPVQASARGGLNNLFYMMVLPIGIHDKSDSY